MTDVIMYRLTESDLIKLNDLRKNFQEISQAYAHLGKMRDQMAVGAGGFSYKIDGIYMAQAMNNQMTHIIEQIEEKFPMYDTETLRKYLPT